MTSPALALLLGAPVALSMLPAAARGPTVSPADVRALGVRHEKSSSGEYSYVRPRSPEACVVSLEDGDVEPWIAGDALGSARWLTNEVGLSPRTTDARTTVGLERIVVDPTAGVAPRLERALFAARSPDAKLEPLLRGASIPLVEVARTPDGVVVYAYRAGKHVHVLAPTTGPIASFQSSPEPPRRTPSREDSAADDGTLPSGSVTCGIVAAWLSWDAPGGAAAQLTGAVQDESKEPAPSSGAALTPAPPSGAAVASRMKQTPRPYVVHASLSKTSRDVEPVLAVSVRML